MTKQCKPFCRFLLWAVLGIVLVSGWPIVRTAAQTPSLRLDQAQTLTAAGQEQLERGNPQSALEQWRKAERQYRQLGDATGAIGSQLNQARALQALGFYHQAKTLLEQVVAVQQDQPSSALKANGLLTLGNLLRLLGEYDASQEKLEASLSMALAVNALPDTQAAYLHLGNTLLAKQQQPTALNYFQQAAAIAAPLKLSAQLHQLRLLLQLDRTAEATALLPQIKSQLTVPTPTQLTIYGQIELADILRTWAPKPPHPEFSLSPAAQWLATAAQQAHALGDHRAESYAIGRLGQLYEHTQQWTEAKQLTQKALALASGVNVPEMLYQWQWQMGRILRSQGDLSAAITAYTQAVGTLQSLRSDLVAIGQEVQYSFRDRVEPVYRELVDLLLQPDASQQALRTAREMIESLQLAELNNFFREPCLDAARHAIDAVDQTAAVFYPIMLPDRLEVILALPGQPLQHYATQRPQKQIEADIVTMQISLRPTSFMQERQAAAQTIYHWLVQPAVNALIQHHIKTLVFVLDGPLRGLPLAALHDGHHYLIEQYPIAIAPGLRLFNARGLQHEKIHALVGGLSEGIAGTTPLPGVQREIDQISQQIPTQVLLNRSFTTAALTAEVQSAPFNVVHLATHGQFSSNAHDTYIQMWDGRLMVKDLQSLLNQRSLNDPTAIELLVLSACETAAGDNWATLGMAGVAVRSGARSTLATLWNVNDTSTATLIATFYKALTQPDTSKAQALQQAQIALIRSQAFKHPFYWAPFILVGNWS